MKSDKSKVAGSLSLIAGLWLVLYSFMLSLGITSNFFIVGVLVTLFGIVELSSKESTMWVSWVNGILGAWLLVSPAFLTLASTGAMWNSVILGVVIAAVAIWGGMSSSSSIGMGHPRMG